MYGDRKQQDWGRGDRREEDVHTISVKAGKRTYFFDIRATRAKDLYLTITESKRQNHANGEVTYSKHKLFLYKEDFEKFADGLKDSLEKISELQGTGDYQSGEHHGPKKDEGGSSDEVRFEDL
ncbi:MAG: DUF3276 family protein [Crocinitomicaceae bacterium TMED114]|nr:MAG: DUF3276 family protein [Crocinitomicaceae bacterium TMED114]